MHPCDTSLRFRLSHRGHQDNNGEDGSTSQWIDGGSSSEYLVVTGHGQLADEHKTDDNDDNLRSSHFTRSQGFIDLSTAIREASKVHIDESLNTYHKSVYLDKLHDPDAVLVRWYSPRDLQLFVDRVVHRVEQFCDKQQSAASIRALEHVHRHCREMAEESAENEEEKGNEQQHSLAIDEERERILESLQRAYATFPELVGLEPYIAEYMEVFPDPVLIKCEYRKNILQWHRDSRPNKTATTTKNRKLTNSLFPRSSKNKQPNNQMTQERQQNDERLPQRCRSITQCARHYASVLASTRWSADADADEDAD